MAIWQYHIYFIPRQSLLDLFGQDVTELDYENALTIDWWINLNLNTNELLPLLQEFGDIQEWTLRSKGLRSFGDSASNDITMCFDKNSSKVLELSCRLDLRQLDLHFVNKVFAIAKQFDCLLMDIKGSLFQPSLAALTTSIELSNANSYVTDPIKFLQDLSDGDLAPEGI